MKTYRIFILCIICSGCNFTYENNTNQHTALEQLRQETDSLKNEIHTLKKQAINKETLDVKPVLVSKDSISTKHILPRIIPLEKKIVPKQTRVTKKPDTTFYFYTNTKKISVKIDPKNVQGRKMKIQFYDFKGIVTFEKEDIFASYSISTEIKEFHPNGAVKRIVIHYNPGASMHWYETIITFDTGNTPLWKEEITYPMTLDNRMDNKFYWEANTKQWIKQELVIEQPVVK